MRYSLPFSQMKGKHKNLSRVCNDFHVLNVTLVKIDQAFLLV